MEIIDEARSILQNSIMHKLAITVQLKLKLKQVVQPDALRLAAANSKPSQAKPSQANPLHCIACSRSINSMNSHQIDVGVQVPSLATVNRKN